MGQVRKGTCEADLEKNLKAKKIQSVFFFALRYPWCNSGEKFEGQRIQSQIRELTQGALVGSARLFSQN